MKAAAAASALDRLRKGRLSQRILFLCAFGAQSGGVSCLSAPLSEIWQMDSRRRRRRSEGLARGLRRRRQEEKKLLCRY